jgi:peptide/nickel transport system substrate-binding protein
MVRKFAAALVLAAGLMQPAFAAEKTTLTVDHSNDAATLDPQLQWDPDSYAVYRNIFDNLVTRDTAGKIVPQIATAWHIVNPTTMDFDLRSDVKFQDGTPLTADDVVFSIKRIIDPKLHSSQLSQFDQIADAKALSPTKVEITTKTPYPVLLAQLVKLSIIPKAYVEKVGDAAFNVKPMGSGPYKFVSWQKGVAVTLAANENYWRGKPPFAKVVFRAVPDVATRIADLQTGRADIAMTIPPDQAISMKKDKSLEVLSVPTERVGYLFLNAENGPTKDVRVRRAIAMSIDKAGLVDALLQGFGKPVDSIGAPPIFGYSPDAPKIPYDPKAARALIVQAGAKGAELTFLTSPAYDRRVVEALQQMIDDVGLNVKIVTLDMATYLTRREGAPSDAGNLALGVWSCGCQDADGVIYPLFRTGSNWSKYSDPAFDRAVDAARSTLDPKARLADYKTAYDILGHDVPGVGLFQSYAIYGARKQLHWTPTPNESFFIMDMSWK